MERHQDRLDTLVRQLRERKLSRRQFIVRGLVLGFSMSTLAALVAACVQPAATATPVPPAATATPVPATAVPAAAAPVVKAVANLTKPNSEIKIGASWHIRGHPYFNACEAGVDLAAKRYGLKYLFGGPTTVDTRAQVAEFDTWITQKYDAIVVSAGDAEGMTPIINKAVDAGILVITLDSDAYASKRHVFDNQANDEDQAKAQFEQLAQEMGGEGEWAFIVGNFSQAQKMYQLEVMKKLNAEKYPKMTLVATEECKDDATKSGDIAKQLMTAYPNLKGILSNSGAGFPGAARGIEELGKSGKVKVTGLTVPSAMKVFIKNGTVQRGFIWDARKLGYRAIAIANELLHGRDITRDTKLALWDGEDAPADVRTNLQNPKNLDIILGPPLGIDASNVDTFTY